MRIARLLPYVFLVVPMLVLVVNNCVGWRASEKLALRLAGLTAVCQLAAAFLGLVLLSQEGGGELSFTLLWSPSPETAYFTVSLKSYFLMLCVGLVCLVSVLTAGETVLRRRGSYCNLLMTLMLGMNGMLLVRDLFSLYVFLEITGISSFVLIAMFQTKEGLEGAFKYLTMSALATVLVLSGLAFLFLRSGSLAFRDIGPWLLTGPEGKPDLMSWSALALLISGFAIKTGAVPFHSWLPDAHQSADTAVSVLLSGIVIKVAGVYSLIILTRLFPGVRALYVTLAVLGLISITVGALLALRQDHFKRVLAYSSVSQMGYILLGLATGSPLGLVGALLHAFNHATFKSTLFVNAAALHARLDTLDIREMGGLQKVMPITAFSSVCALLSTAGIPPLAGFWSKLLIVLALWDGGLGGVGAAALVLSILTAGYFLLLQKRVFFGALDERWEHVTEIGGGIRLAELGLTALNLLVGVGFPLVLLYFRHVGMI